jgi:hypothetical protein
MANYQKVILMDAFRRRQVMAGSAINYCFRLTVNLVPYSVRPTRNGKEKASRICRRKNGTVLILRPKINIFSMHWSQFKARLFNIVIDLFGGHLLKLERYRED